MNEKLEYRMYGLVPYNISPIQQGIQFGHAVVEYMVEYRDFYDLTKWAEKDKTFIILNGGTTNTTRDFQGISLGTLNQHADALVHQRIPISYFHEPDLGNQLTAVVFLVDERVFNKEKYPDFKDLIIDEIGLKIYEENKIDFLETSDNKVNPIASNIYPEKYKKWVETIEEKNVWLRDFLRPFKLA